MDAASAPMHTPRRLSGWIKAFQQTLMHAGEHKLSLLAAGVAFYGFLAIFPALGAALMVWGLFADPASVFEKASFIRTLVPAGAYDVIVDQLSGVEQTEAASGAGSTFGALFAIGFAIWAASKGARALILALNVAYEVQSTRNIVMHYVVAFAFTLGGIVFMVMSLAAIAAIPPILEAISLGLLAEMLIHVARWLGVLFLFMTAVALLYFIAPAGHRPPFRLVTPGGVGAVILWIVASIGFSLYAQNFANYNETFGALGAAAALLMWLWISAFIVCLGAQFNAVLTGMTGKNLPMNASDSEGPTEEEVAEGAGENADRVEARAVAEEEPEEAKDAKAQPA